MTEQTSVGFDDVSIIQFDFNYAFGIRPVEDLPRHAVHEYSVYAEIVYVFEAAVDREGVYYDGVSWAQRGTMELVSAHEPGQLQLRLRSVSKRLPRRFIREERPPCTRHHHTYCNGDDDRQCKKDED